VEEVVDMARYLLHTGDNVKLGPQILLRTMRNPMGGQHAATVIAATRQVSRSLDTPACRGFALLRAAPEHALMCPASPLAEGNRSRPDRRIFCLLRCT